MAVAIGVQITGIKDVVERLKKLDGEAKKLTRNAINDTAVHVRAQAVKVIRAEWNVPAKTIRASFAIRRATLANLKANVESSGKPTPLLVFDANQVAEGVTYKLKAGRRSLLKSAFRATMRSGHQGVFVRHPTRKMRKKNKAAIIEKAVIGVHHMWQKRLDEQLPEASAFLRKRIKQLLKLQAERASK